MAKKLKSGKECLAVGINNSSAPIVVYRTEKDGTPIITNEDVLLIGFSGLNSMSVDGVSFAKTRLFLHGPNYKFLRGENLENGYDPNKCKLSEEDWKKLRGIYAEKSRGLERRV